MINQKVSIQVDVTMRDEKMDLEISASNEFCQPGKEHEAMIICLAEAICSLVCDSDNPALGALAIQTIKNNPYKKNEIKES